MKVVKYAIVALVAYIGVVAVFEGLLGYFQPQSAETLVITTTDADGIAHDRVVSRLDSGDGLYVAANHWPRAWFRRALENPRVEVTHDGTTRPFRAVPVSGAEHERVDAEHELGLVFRVLTGFPPRRFLRLDPV
jgi:hypothetical protein